MAEIYICETLLVAGISPLLQGRNGYLPSIGRKGRVLDGNARKMK